MASPDVVYARANWELLSNRTGVSWNRSVERICCARIFLSSPGHVSEVAYPDIACSIEWDVSRPQVTMKVVETSKPAAQETCATHRYCSASAMFDCRRRERRSWFIRGRKMPWAVRRKLCRMLWGFSLRVSYIACSCAKVSMESFVSAAQSCLDLSRIAKGASPPCNRIQCELVHCGRSRGSKIWCKGSRWC